MISYKTTRITLVLLLAVLAGTSFAADPDYQSVDPNNLITSGHVNADGSGGTLEVDYWVWDGGNGYYYYTYRLYNTAFVPFVQYFTVTNPSREMYWITGNSGGWNPQNGTQGSAWVPSSPINQINVVQWSSNDPFNSNIYPGYSSWGHEEGQLFQFASKLPPAIVGFTVMQGDASINASGLIAAPGSPTTNPRSPGYWKHQCNVSSKGKRKEKDSIPFYLPVIGAMSNVFDSMSMDDAYTILAVDNSSDMEQKAKKQLLALWLNVTSHKLLLDTEMTIEDPLGQTVINTISGFINEIETVINNGLAEQLEYVKDLAEILNHL